MKSGARGDESGIGWILPTTRIQDELGMHALYNADGTAVLISLGTGAGSEETPRAKFPRLGDFR